MTQPISPRKKTESSRPLGGLLPRNIFDDLFQHYLSDESTGVSEMMRATMDVAETEHSFEIKVDLPGVRAEDVDIQLDNNTLTVRGHRDISHEEHDKHTQFHRVERYSGNFARSIVLPSSIDEAEASAEFEDGVLMIVVPKSEEAKPRKINIKS